MLQTYLFSYKLDLAGACFTTDLAGGVVLNGILVFYLSFSNAEPLARTFGMCDLCRTEKMIVESKESKRLKCYFDYMN